MYQSSAADSRPHIFQSADSNGANLWLFMTCPKADKKEKKLSPHIQRVLRRMGRQ